jgi:hypothetical protein
LPVAMFSGLIVRQTETVRSNAGTNSREETLNE